MARERIRVLLVDDHELVRQGLRRMLELEEDMEVVGEASSAEEVVGMVTALSPDIVLMDIKMPTASGLDATRQLKERGLSGGVIILSLYEEYLPEALEAGAGGYLVKDVKREELANAIRKVCGGEMALAKGLLASAPLVEATLRRLQDTARQRPRHALPLQALLPGAPPEVDYPGADEKPLSPSPDPSDPAQPTSPYHGLFETDPFRDVQAGAHKSDQAIAEVVIPPPVDTASLLLLSRKLREHYQVEILEIEGSWQQGARVKLMMRRPVDLQEVLAQMPEVAQVAEMNPEDDNLLPRSGLRALEESSTGVVLSPRLRLVLRAGVILN